MTTPTEHTTAQLHPSGHIDGFSRAQLPPAEQWPAITLEGVYAVPPRLNAAVELLDRLARLGARAQLHAQLVERRGVALDHKTRRQQRLPIACLGAEALQHIVPGLRGVADAELLQRLGA